MPTASPAPAAEPRPPQCLACGFPASTLFCPECSAAYQAQRERVMADRLAMLSRTMDILAHGGSPIFATDAELVRHLDRVMPVLSPQEWARGGA